MDTPKSLEELFCREFTKLQDENRDLYKAVHNQVAICTNTDSEGELGVVDQHAQIKVERYFGIDHCSMLTSKKLKDLDIDEIDELIQDLDDKQLIAYLRDNNILQAYETSFDTMLKVYRGSNMPTHSYGFDYKNGDLARIYLDTSEVENYSEYVLHGHLDILQEVTAKRAREELTLLKNRLLI